MTKRLSIDAGRFNSEAYIRERVAVAATSDQGSLRTALRYLYMDDGPINLERDRLKTSRPYFDEAERIVVQWLQTRTNGSERKNYGSPALRAARESRYRCQECGFDDVRALNLDHVEGRVSGASFACLCANCHTIKSRAKDWLGTARRGISAVHEAAARTQELFADKTHVSANDFLAKRRKDWGDV